jgi:uncharacterized protein (DUF1810 family)
VTADQIKDGKSFLTEGSDRELFTNALDQFYQGQPDPRTLALLR